MGWWKKEKTGKKPVIKAGFWNNQHDYEYVEARIYECPGKRNEMKEPRPRRLDTHGRFSYR